MEKIVPVTKYGPRRYGSPKGDIVRGQFWCGGREKNRVREVLTDGEMVYYRERYEVGGEFYTSSCTYISFRNWAHEQIKPTWEPAVNWSPGDQYPEIREIVSALISPTETGDEAIAEAAKEVVREQCWPIYETDDDPGLVESEYVKFAQQVIRRLRLKSQLKGLRKNK
jgi:hypothetical protein